MKALSTPVLERLVKEIGWSRAQITIQQLSGDHFNRADRIDVCLGQEKRSLLVKRYAEFGGQREKKARVEFKALSWLWTAGVSVPEPVYLDEHGEVLGCPAIVTEFVEGKIIHRPDDEGPWATRLARTLAAIHATPCGLQATEFLLDAKRETTWFLKGGKIPGFMKRHPDGEKVWRTVAELAAGLEQNPPGLVHVDYWPGNVLWHNGQITAVIDWEEAAYGDPAIDVAYARMELSLNGLERAAEIFTRCYEEATGKPLINLSYWDLVAAARPMYDPEWEKEIRPQLRRFIARTLEEVRGEEVNR